MQNISVIGYSVATLAFLLLTALLATTWRGKKEGAILLLCSFLSTIWAASVAYQGWNNSPISILFVTTELLRIMAWVGFLLFITSRIRQKGAVNTVFKVIGPLSVITAGIVAVILLYAVFNNGLVPRIIGFDLRIILFLILTLFGLILLEQIYRNTSLNARWAIKFLCFGLGGIFVFDFYLYSDALLLNGIDVDIWGARGYVNTLVVPLIAIGVARNPEWSLDVFVSRAFVFHSATIMGAGTYLVVMAAGGYYINRIGGNWGGMLQVAFLFGAVILLFSLLSSGQLRARIRVFLSKHFFSYHYDYRDEWTRLTQTLSESWQDSDMNKTIVSAIAKIVESPGGMLWLKTSLGDYELVASSRMPDKVDCNSQDNRSLVEFLRERKWVIDLNEIESQPESYVGLELPGWLAELDDAWLVTPLLANKSLIGESESSNTKDNRPELGLLGFVVLTRPLAKVSVNWEVRDLLRISGRQCASYLALLKANEDLIDARQFEAFNRLSAYVVHDLKNVIAQLSLIVSNAERHRENPEFLDDVIITVKNATGKMGRMLEQLRKNRLVIDDASQVININKILAMVIKEHSANLPVPEYNSSIGPVFINANEDRFTAVIGHLIQNAQEATPDDGTVEMVLSDESEWVTIEIKDTGCGMDKEFLRNHLFRPFVTTKGNAGMGIGVYESKEFVSSLGGHMDVISTPGEGTCFTIKLQKAHQSAGLSDSVMSVRITG